MRDRLRSTLIWAAKLLVLAALLALAVRALYSIDWSELHTLVRSADWPWLLVAAVLLVGRPAAWGERWRLVAHQLGMPLAHGWGFFSVAAAMAVDHLTPTARLFGGFLRARWLARKWDRSIGSAFGSVLYEQLTHEVFMALATMFALVLMPALLGRWLVAASIAVLAITFTTLAWGWTHRHADRVFGAIARSVGRRAASSESRMRELAVHGETVMNTVKLLIRDRSLGWRCLAWAGFILLVSVLAQWAVFHAVGAPPAFAVLLSTVTLGATAGVLAGTPGGVGATESAMVASYVLLGVDPTDATASVLLYRGLHYLLVLGLGFPSLAAFELRVEKG